MCVNYLVIFLQIFVKNSCRISRTAHSSGHAVKSSWPKLQNTLRSFWDFLLLQGCHIPHPEDWRCANAPYHDPQGTTHVIWAKQNGNIIPLSFISWRSTLTLSDFYTKEIATVHVYYVVLSVISSGVASTQTKTRLSKYSRTCTWKHSSSDIRAKVLNFNSNYSPQKAILARWASG